MLLEEIKNGENKEIEYKRELPKHSDKYMKSVIAFANSYGGKIIFGVEDETREIVGVEEEKAANLLYFMIKDHPYADGCKRIAASLFLEFLDKNNALFQD